MGSNVKSNKANNLIHQPAAVYPVTPVDESIASISPHREQSPHRDNTQREDDDDNDDEVDSSPSAYDEEFNQPDEIREEMYRMDKNKMRDPSEGKACLDRYEH